METIRHSEPAALLQFNSRLHKPTFISTQRFFGFILTCRPHSSTSGVYSAIQSRFSGLNRFGGTVTFLVDVVLLALRCVFRGAKEKPVSGAAAPEASSSKSMVAALPGSMSTSASSRASLGNAAAISSSSASGSAAAASTAAIGAVGIRPLPLFAFAFALAFAESCDVLRGAADRPDMVMRCVVGRVTREGEVVEFGAWLGQGTAHC